VAAKKRQRFNAFEDFSSEDQLISQEDNFESTLFSKETINTPQQKIERIEYLYPSQMLPDRFQPRRLLPAEIRQFFFSGKINCYQAAEQWLNLAKKDNGAQKELDRLLAMGGSFEEHGQIKPITGTWTPTDSGEYIFIIETGERRFWAACLQTVHSQLTEEIQLRIEAVERPTRQRQVLENQHAETPSAVSQACEIASLILAEMGIDPSADTTDEFDYFRCARSQRMPAGMWDKITPIMQLSRPRMVQLLNILQLPTPQLDIANRHRLPERVLREILSHPNTQWEQLINIAAQNEVTSDDIANIKQTSPVEPKSLGLTTKYEPPKPLKSAANGLRRFKNALSNLDEIDREHILDELADEIVAKNEGQKFLDLLTELEMLLKARLKRK
jgi:hypothetical protein